MEILIKIIVEIIVTKLILYKVLLLYYNSKVERKIICKNIKKTLAYFYFFINIYF